MNHLLTDTFNIDSVIQPLQIKLFDNLIERWNTDKLDGYGRVYKNEKEGKLIPEVYISDKKNYQETFYNNQSCFFFIDSDNHKTTDEHTYSVSTKIVFMVNLSDIKTSSERADADVKRDVIEFVRKYGYEFDITGYLKTVKEVFRGLDYTKIMTNDMQPLHVFAIEGNLSYTINNKCD